MFNRSVAFEGIFFISLISWFQGNLGLAWVHKKIHILVEENTWKWTITLLRKFAFPQSVVFEGILYSSDLSFSRKFRSYLGFKKKLLFLEENTYGLNRICRFWRNFLFSWSVVFEWIFYFPDRPFRVKFKGYLVFIK